MFARIDSDTELAEALRDMKTAHTDLSGYEIKDASGGFPDSVVMSMTAFANTSGGVVILGISEKTFHPTRINVKTLQAALSQAARERIYPPLSPEILLLHYENQPVIVANVPEQDLKLKPSYVKRYGRAGGSYIRTGDGDYRMTLYEIDRFMENQYRVARNDIATVPDATTADLDNRLLHSWLDTQRGGGFGGTETMSDERLMINRRVATYDTDGTLRPTVAGLLALGEFPQKFYPRLNIVFTAFPATDKGTLDNGKRFVDSENIDGPIPVMLSNTLRAVARNMRHGAVMDGALRRDAPEYPLDAVREAVANALMHRDYSPDSQGAPVRVEMYANRLEVINPGGLFGSMTVDMLATDGGTQSRNQFLSRILEDVPFIDAAGRSGHVVENRGTGYEIIENALNREGMAPPVVKSTLDEFRLIITERATTQNESITPSGKDKREAVLAYLATVSEAGSTQIARATGISLRTVRETLARLVEDGLIVPLGAPTSPKRRYRLP